MGRVKGRGLQNVTGEDNDDGAFNDRTFDEWVKLADKPVAYLRVSTVKQEGTLDTQQGDVAKKAKSLRLKGIKYFAEQGSGKNNPDRIELSKMIEFAVEQKRKGKTPIVLLRDIQRFARDPWDVGHIYKYKPTVEDSLWTNDIPLMALNERVVTGTKNFPQESGDLLAPLFISIGGQEVTKGTKQSKAGVRAAAEDGILAGTPINLWFKEPINPIRELVRLLRIDGLTQARMAEIVGRSRSWVKDTKFKFAEIREKHPLGEEGLQKWLDVGDMVREMEKKHGPRSGTSAIRRMVAVGRKTSGYFARPWEYPAPTQDDLDEYYANYTLYQPKRK
jgi:DNA invertase Pin-like site-specific DNA recombinase